MALDWEFNDNDVCSIDEYEKTKSSISIKDYNALSYNERKNIKGKIIYEDYTDTPYDTGKGCNCGRINLSKLKTKNAKLMLKNYGCNDISGIHTQLITRLKTILKEGKCLCKDNNDCECAKDEVECFSGCSCKGKCK